MRYVKVALLFLGVVIVCGLTTILSNLETVNGGISSIVLITAIAFIWHLTTGQNRKFFS